MTAADMVARVNTLAEGWSWDAVSIGYPGPVRDGVPVAERSNLTRDWVGFDFAAAFGKPLKLVNDATMQALGSHTQGKMLFLGLGTGLGTALVVGAGGILTELLKDSVTLILPTTRSEIERALKTLKVWTLVAGFRGKSGDAEAVFRAVEAVADFAAANRGLVEEVDVNPLLVLKDGAIAVDALIKMRKP